MAPRTRHRGGWTLTVLLCAGLLVGGGALVWWIFSTEPVAVQEGATRQTAMLVDVTRPEGGTFRPVITAMGTVQASRRIVLRPRVGGEVMEISDHFAPGATVEKGEWIVRLDPADYENTLRLRQSDVQQAESDLQIEMGQQRVAEKEFELFGEKLKEDGLGLMLRKPQLDRAKARLEAAKAALDLAALELERTRVVAPFDAQILSREVNVGSQVGPGDPLATLVGLDTYWVEAMVPLSRLQWIPAPDPTGRGGADIRVRNRTAWPAGVHRSGYLYRLIGELEERSRLARVLVAVDDPLARAAPDLPALIIGSYVEVRIPCRPISDVIRLPRDYLRNGDTIWVMEGGNLAIRKVSVTFLDEVHVYIGEGLGPDDRVVVTNLATVVQGAPLRLRETGAPAGEESAEE